MTHCCHTHPAQKSVVTRTSNNSKRRQCSLDSQRGMTLVELMISVVLGLILIAGVLNIFVVNRETFRSNENLARMQENARTAFDFMARDLRESGVSPCGAKLVSNVIRVSAAIPWWADWGAGTIRGVDGGQDVTDIVAFGTSSGTRVSATDAVLVIRSAQDEKIISGHVGNVITVNSAGLAANDVAMACDPNGAAIFQVSSVTSSSPYTIDHSVGSTANCSANLGYPTALDCPTTTPPVKVFSAGGLVAKLVTTFWYVGTNANGKRSLFRTRLTGASSISEEMLPGVKDLQMEYLTKNLTTSVLATDWIPANDPAVPANPNPVYAAASGGWSENNVNQTVAVRITMTLQSEDNIADNRVPIERKLIHVVGLRPRDTLFQVTP